VSNVEETKRKVRLRKLQNIGLRAKKQGKKLRARKNTIAKAGNYAAPVDPTGMDPAMQVTLGIKKKGKRK